MSAAANSATVPVGRKIDAAGRIYRPKRSYGDSLLLPAEPLRRALDTYARDHNLNDLRIAALAGLTPRRLHAIRHEGERVTERTVDLIGCRVLGDPTLVERLHPGIDWAAVPVSSCWHCPECGEPMIWQAPRCGLCEAEAQAGERLETATQRVPARGLTATSERRAA